MKSNLIPINPAWRHVRMMATYAEADRLRQQYIYLVAEAQGIHDLAETEGRHLTAQEGRRFKAATDEADALNARIEQLDAERGAAPTLIEDIEAGDPLTKSRARQVPPPPRAMYASEISGNQLSLNDSFSSGSFSPIQNSSVKPLGERGSADGYSSFSEFLNSLASGREDRRLRQAPRNAAEVGGTGGYLVPTQFLAEILGGAVTSSQLLSRCGIVQMTSMEMAIAGFDQGATHSTGGVGGLTLQWGGESSALTAANPIVRGIQLKAHKGSIYCLVSNELLDDSPAAPGQLEEIFREACAFGIERSLITGNGVGQPLGILNDPSLITVSKLTSQSADTVFTENVYSMYSRLHPSLSGGAVWLANPTVLPQILGLNSRVMNVAGNEVVAGGVPLYTQPGAIASAPQGAILGLPLILTEACPAVGDLGDLLLVAPKQYCLGLRKMASIETSQHLKFDFDQTAFRLIVRIAGQGKWASAMTPLYGSTLSWCVALQAR